GGRAASRTTLPELRPLLTAAWFAPVLIAVVSLTTIGVILAAWLIVRWSLTAPAIAAEDLSPREALRRSASLVRRNWWRTASFLLFVTIIALLLGPLVGTLLLFVSHASFNFINLLASVIYALVLPYAAIATTYLYFDLRVAKRQTEAAEQHELLPMEAPPREIPTS